MAAREHNVQAYQVLQPEYNLYDRGKFDGALRDTVIAHDIGVVTYYSLASGFLSGKYRSEADLSKSKRGKGIAKYLDNRGLALLKVLDEVASQQHAKPAEVALAWLIAREGVTAPIASATSVEQVASFAKAASLRLSDEQIQALSDVR